MHRIKTPVPVESLQAVGLLCDWKVPYHIYDHNYKEKIDWFTIRIMKLRKKIKKFHTSVNSSRDDKRTHEWIYILVHSFNASHHKTRPSKQLSINQKKKKRSERKKQSSLKTAADLHHIKLKVRRREKTSVLRGYGYSNEPSQDISLTVNTSQHGLAHSPRHTHTHTVWVPPKLITKHWVTPS